MTALIAVALAMTVAAVAAVAWPLLRRDAKPAAKRADYDLAVYRDQLNEIDRDRERGLLDAAEAEAARIEVQRRMLAAADAGGGGEAAPPVAGRVLAGGLAAAVAAAAFAIYFTLGSPDVPNFPFAARNVGGDIVAQGASPEHAEVAGLAAKLAARLKDDPKDLEGWLLLARTYGTIGDLVKAAQAYRHAVQLSDGRTDIAGMYGEALVRANNGQVTQEAFTLFNDIVKVEPFDPQARYYVGLALAQQNRVQDALQAWVDLRALSPKGAPWLDIVNDQIGRAETELKIAAGSVQPTAAALALAKQRPAAAAPQTPAAPGQPGPSAEDMQAASQMSAGDREQMIRSMVGRLAERLKQTPDDLAGWQRLANSYRVLGETEKAAEAQARVDALTQRGAAAPAPAAPSAAQPGPSAADVEAAGRMSSGDRQQMIRGMVERLAERLKDNPNDLEGWRRLARSYRVLGENDKAKEAEARVRELESRR